MFCEIRMRHLTEELRAAISQKQRLLACQGEPAQRPLPQTLSSVDERFPASHLPSGPTPLSTPSQPLALDPQVSAAPPRTGQDGAPVTSEMVLQADMGSNTMQHIEAQALPMRDLPSPSGDNVTTGIQDGLLSATGTPAAVTMLGAGGQPGVCEGRPLPLARPQGNAENADQGPQPMDWVQTPQVLTSQRRPLRSRKRPIDYDLTYPHILQHHLMAALAGYPSQVTNLLTQM
jgi:hypothetical protein